MSGFFREALDAIGLEIERFRNRAFLEAVMAAAALVATADGAVKLAELAMIDEALDTVRALKIYDPHDAVDIYRDYARALHDEPALARDRALKTIARIADEPEAAHVLVKVALAIAKSDDALDEPERDALGHICDALRLPRSEAGL
jgi:tellurite resistance protein TerB